MSILIHTEVFRTPVIFHRMTQGNSYVCQLRMLARVADTDTNWHWRYFMKQGEWSPHGFRCTLKPPGSWAAFLFQLCAFKHHVSCACLSSGDSRVPMPFGALCQRQAEEERGVCRADLCLFIRKTKAPQNSPWAVWSYLYRPDFGLVNIIWSPRKDFEEEGYRQPNVIVQQTQDSGNKERGRSECRIRMHHEKRSGPAGCIDAYL